MCRQKLLHHVWRNYCIMSAEIIAGEIIASCMKKLLRNYCIMHGEIIEKLLHHAWRNYCIMHGEIIASCLQKLLQEKLLHHACRNYCILPAEIVASCLTVQTDSDKFSHVWIGNRCWCCIMSHRHIYVMSRRRPACTVIIVTSIAHRIENPPRRTSERFVEF